jgi:hypothetical protein
MFSANSSQVSDDKLFVEDVFSTYLYTGNSSASLRTIENGINLAGKGGLVWTKARNQTKEHILFDSARPGMVLSTDLTQQSLSRADYNFTMASNGYSFTTANTDLNNSTYNYASWTFREAPKFFDVVTWTGTGADRNIAHNLGIAPGLIIIKRTDSTGDWWTYHRSIPNFSLKLNSTAAQVNQGGLVATSTTFTLYDNANVNASGGTYVAYLYAHDATSDGIIQCGSYTGNGTANSLIATLGFEPQWFLVKRTDTTSDWIVVDVMRGAVAGGDVQNIYSNSSAAEVEVGSVAPGATGIMSGNTAAWGESNASGGTYIYMAIRRGPMRTPTLGTSVFAPFATSLAVDTAITTNFPVDLMISGQRNSNNATDNWAFIDRLRGATASNNTSSTPQKRIKSTSANAEDSPTYPYAYNWWNTGLVQGYGLADASQIYYTLRRAPGFFDEVCYTGTGVARTVNHNLGVAPELIIIKNRGATGAWIAYCSALSSPNDKYLLVNLAAAVGTVAGTWKTPTATTFGMDISFSELNASGNTYVAYLFASAPGVSKVGSYTGNGSSQTINCAFAAGARFVMIKRTDAAGDWYVWDAARGIVAANDPHISLNDISAEVTTDDSVDTASSGFVVNQVAATNVNVNAATYIYLAIA